MDKTLVSWALILLAVGCRGEPMAPKISLAGIRVDESQAPMPFVIELRNHGSEAVEITDVGVGANGSVIIPLNGAPSGYSEPVDLVVDQHPGHPSEIAAGSSGVACGFVRWRRPAEAPSAIVAAELVFRVTFSDGKTIVSPPKAVLLSDRNAAPDIRQAAKGLTTVAAGELVEQLEGLASDRAPLADQLLDEIKGRSDD
jgi:hypothetical protein